MCDTGPPDRDDERSASPREKGEVRHAPVMEVQIKPRFRCQPLICRWDSRPGQAQSEERWWPLLQQIRLTLVPLYRHTETKQPKETPDPDNGDKQKRIRGCGSISAQPIRLSRYRAELLESGTTSCNRLSAFVRSFVRSFLGPRFCAALQTRSGTYQLASRYAALKPTVFSPHFRSTSTKGHRKSVCTHGADI